MDCRVEPGNDGVVVGTPSDAFASDSFAHPTRYAPSTVMTMSFSSVDCLRNAISG
jgi:hypothetical protein